MMDLIDVGGACRDEQCTRVDVHPAHPPIPLRGRTPKACPRCLEALDDGRCKACGWIRANSTKLSASPWALCNPCPGEGCVWCGGTGILPRVRHSLTARLGVRHPQPCPSVGASGAEAVAPTGPPGGPPEGPRRAPASSTPGRSASGSSIPVGRASPFARALLVGAWL